MLNIRKVQLASNAGNCGLIGTHLIEDIHIVVGELVMLNVLVKALPLIRSQDCEYILYTRKESISPLPLETSV